METRKTFPIRYTDNANDAIKCPEQIVIDILCSFQEHAKKHTMKSSMKIKRQVEELMLIKGNSCTIKQVIPVGAVNNSCFCFLRAWCFGDYTSSR